MTTNTTYKNGFYNKYNQYSRQYFQSEHKAINYKGYFIHNYRDMEFHIVKNDVCVGMYAGINGAKCKIDELTTFK